VGREVFAKQAIFVDREDDHEGVEDAEQDEADIPGEAEAIELVGDERPEHREARRIGPQSLPQEADHQDRFDDPVAEQIESVEMVLGDREGLRELEQMGRDPVVLVLDQLIVAPSG
jgi:hypothetical protein